MQIYGATQSSQSTSGTGYGMPAGDLTNTFLTLLMTQLKVQDPLSPMDPTQMVSQLVQFTSLGELMQIRSAVEQLSTQQTEGAAQSAATGGE